MQKSDFRVKRLYQEGAPFSSDLIVDENTHLKRFSVIQSGIVGLLIITILIVAIAFSIVTNRPPVTLSFAADEYGRVVEIEPVSQPYSPGRVSLFAVKNVKKALHISFTDYQDHFLGLSKVFTNDGFNSYQDQLVSKGWITKITEDNLTMWVEPRTAPKFTATGTSNGAYEYDLRFEVDLLIGGGESVYSPVPVAIDVRIIRSMDNLAGLKIKRLLLSEI